MNDDLIYIRREVERVREEVLRVASLQGGVILASEFASLHSMLYVLRKDIDARSAPKPPRAEQAPNVSEYVNQVTAALREQPTPATEDQALRIAELELERDEAQTRNDEHYKAAMFMSEKHRRLWVEECQARKKIESTLARLRGKVEAIRDDVTAFQIRQPMIALHDDFVINIRDRLSALLTEGTAEADAEKERLI